MREYKAATGFCEDVRCTENQAIEDAIYRHMEFTDEMPLHTVRITCTYDVDIPEEFLSSDYEGWLRYEINRKRRELRDRLLSESLSIEFIDEQP